MGFWDDDTSKGGFPALERLRLAFPANGKRQKWPRDHDFFSFVVYRLRLLSECKQFRVSHKHENYFALFSYTYYLFRENINGNLTTGRLPFAVNANLNLSTVA